MESARAFLLGWDLNPCLSNFKYYFAVPHRDGSILSPGPRVHPIGINSVTDQLAGLTCETDSVAEIKKRGDFETIPKFKWWI